MIGRLHGEFMVTVGNGTPVATVRRFGVEWAGIPTAVITNLITIAEQVGAPRIVPGRGIPYPAGDPNLSPAAEQQWRRALVQRALEAVATAVERPTIFQVDGQQR